MSSKSPIFPIPETHHFSDYGFDPQIDSFRVLEESRKHKRDTSRSIDCLHFKLRKPISKDDSRRTHNKNRKKKKKWWRNALLFFQRKWTLPHRQDLDQDVRIPRAKAFRASSVSGPVYITESRRSVSSKSHSYRRNSDIGVPYFSLRELNMEEQHRISTSAAAMPIYLVT